MSSPDDLYAEMNYALLHTIVKAAAGGRYDVLEQFGYDLTLVQHLADMKVRDFVMLTQAPGFFIDSKTKRADNTALGNMLKYAGAKASARNTIDELIRRGATAIMIQAIEPGMDYEDHAWRRKLLGVERHAGRPRNVDDADLAKLETAWDATLDFQGSLAQRFIHLCDDTGLSADQVWTGLRQVVELRPRGQLDPVLLQLPLRRSE